MRDINLYDVVEVSYKRICPTNGFLDALYSAPFSHRSRIFRKVLPSFLVAARSPRFVRRLLPQSGVHACNLSNSDEIDARKRRCEDIKSFPNTLNHFLVGFDVFSTCAYNCSFKYVVWDSGFLQFNKLHIAHFEDSFTRFWAKHHGILRQVFANSIFVRTKFDSFNYLCIRLCSFFFPSFSLWDRVRDVFLFENSICFHVGSSLPKFL